MPPGERDEVTAAFTGRVDERAWCGWPELEAVASIELVLGVAFAEAQVSFEHPDLLVDEGIGVGGVGDLRPRGQIDLDELERPAGGRRYRTATVAAVGIGPRCWSAAPRSSSSPSARAISSESVIPSAADRRPSRAAVGWASARSILAIIARETPERSARADRSSWSRRASRTVAASETESGSDMRFTIKAFTLRS